MNIDAQLPRKTYPTHAKARPEFSGWPPAIAASKVGWGYATDPSQNVAIDKLFNQLTLKEKQQVYDVTKAAKLWLLRELTQPAPHSIWQANLSKKRAIALQYWPKLEFKKGIEVDEQTKESRLVIQAYFSPRWPKPAKANLVGECKLIFDKDNSRERLCPYVQDRGTRGSDLESSLRSVCLSGLEAYEVAVINHRHTSREVQNESRLNKHLGLSNKRFGLSATVKSFVSDLFNKSR